MDIDDLKSPLMRTFAERGYVKDATDLAGLDALAAAGPLRAYIGFDLTADTLHVGSLIQLMVLRILKAHGHEPFVLFGDATTRIGDPSDKNGARPILTPERIEANRQGIVRIVDAIVGPCRHVHNADWLDDMGLLNFMQGAARSFTINRLVATDVVKRRLEAQLPMTLSEALYTTLQGLDFLELSKRHDVALQIGGSDQWTNILSGIDLVRSQSGAQTFGLTTPLMTDDQGRKMGKTADGKAIWLDPAKVSSFDLWQFWRNVPDAKVPEFLGLFTELPMHEVRRLSALHGSEINVAKTVLATEAVAIAHGRLAAEEAAVAASAVFSSPAGTSETMPSMECPEDPRTTVATLAEFAVAAKLCSSKAEARRLAEQGGLRINGDVRRDADAEVDPADFGPADNAMVMAAGKKRRIRFVNMHQPSKLPVASTVQVRADGGWDVMGQWMWPGGLEADCIASNLGSFDEAERRRLRVRLAETA